MTVLFKGNVQGVGFRWRTHEIARSFAVTGRVHNLMDGGVEMICEGESAVCERFLSAVLAAMGRYIADHRVNLSEPTGDLQQFRIAH